MLVVVAVAVAAQLNTQVVVVETAVVCKSTLAKVKLDVAAGA
jgi:hypothetical protein